jgi:hypothetical protein
MSVINVKLYSTGGPRYMRSFYPRFRIFAIGNFSFREPFLQFSGSQPWSSTRGAAKYWISWHFLVILLELIYNHDQGCLSRSLSILWCHQIFLGEKGTVNKKGLKTLFKFIVILVFLFARLIFRSLSLAYKVRIGKRVRTLILGFSC